MPEAKLLFHVIVRKSVQWTNYILSYAGTQCLTPTHAQLQRHRLKFIKKPYKNSYMFRSTTIFRELQYPR